MAWRLIRQLQFHVCRPSSMSEGLNRFISTTPLLHITESQIKKDVAIKDKYFDQELKTKETFLELLEVFKSKQYKTGHCEFIYAALNRMEDYGVDEDLESYKQIIDVMPKGKMMTTNSWLYDMDYYPKHQDCILDVISQMEAKRVTPDRDMFDLLVSIFGKSASPTMKYLRMMYWIPKLRHISPWPAPETRIDDSQEACKLAIKQIGSADLENEVTVFHTKDDELSTEDTWIVNGQSPVQRKLLKYHPRNLPIYVEGPCRLYLGRKNVVDYYILKTDMPQNRRRRKFRDPDDIRCLKIPFFDPPTSEDLIPEFSVHEQSDGIIYATASMGSTSKECLQSWIRLLQKNGNPRLAETAIVFRCGFAEAPSDQLKLEASENEAIDDTEKKG